MIVADTNTIAYLYLPTEQTDEVVRLLNEDPHWVRPLLWRSEFRNVLALYVRKSIIHLDTAIAPRTARRRLGNAKGPAGQRETAMLDGFRKVVEIVQVLHSLSPVFHDWNAVSRLRRLPPSLSVA